MDEVLAVTAAMQSEWSGVFRAIWAGTDFSPPTFHFLLHILPGLSTHLRVVSRVPSIIGGLCAALCIYRISRRRFEMPVAILAFGTTLASPLFVYAVQARQYALITCLLAATLALWDTLSIQTGRYWLRLLGIWAALAGCVSLHFYGIVAVGTVVLCEILWTLSNRKLRLPVWAVFAAVVPVFLAWLPLAKHLRQISAVDQVGSHFYGHPTLNGFYHAVVNLTIGGWQQMILYGGIVFATFASLLWHLPRARKSIADNAKASIPRLDSNFIIVLIALSALPFGAFMMSVVATGSFVARYAVGVTLLPALAIACVLHLKTRASFTALFAMPFLALSLAMLAPGHDRSPTLLNALRILHDRINGAPVFVGDGLLYIELVGALSPAESARMCFISGPADAVSPDPTNANEVLRLATFDNRFRTCPFDQVLRSNDGFYLLRTNPTTTDMAFPALARLDVGLTLIEDRGAAQLYFVAPHPAGKSAY
jgi:hypothetical protein